MVQLTTALPDFVCIYFIIDLNVMHRQALLQEVPICIHTSEEFSFYISWLDLKMWTSITELHTEFWNSTVLQIIL
jgi:hypothetical protein